MTDRQMSMESLLPEGRSDTSAPEVFALGGPPPRGSMLIEASAGTGKTYTLTHLAADYIEREALPISRLLLVTYTRAAAGELRDRLRRVLQERSAASDDPQARARLRTAAEEFDTATITTIHGFCQQVLTTLGVNVPLDPAMRLLADETSLIAQVAADVLAAEALSNPAAGQGSERSDDAAAAEGSPAGALPSLAALTDAIATGSIHPGIRLGGHPDEPDANRLARLTATGLAELERRLARHSLLTYQQLLNRVQAAVSGPKNSGVLNTLRSRFRVALIDEFQDTDPVQWEVFRRLFVEGDPTGPALVLVGDPKQAIYSFRGADIATYLGASGLVQRRANLIKNFRSTPRLLDGLNALFADARFGSSPEGDRTIDYAEVSAGNPSPGTLDGPALRIRCFDMPAHQEAFPTGTFKNGNPKPPPVGLIRHLVGLDLVHQVRQTLNEGVLPQHITVLVTSNADAQRIQRMLSEAGLPAVLGRAGSVVDSPAAEQVRRLLWAMERPAAAPRVRSAALGWFVGLTARQVDSLDDEALADLQGELRDHAQILRRRGVTELAHHLRTHTRPGDTTSPRWANTLGTRLLDLPGGERHLTDLNHIWELLSERTGARGTTPSNALESLAASPDPEEESVEVLQRRTEADGGAIMVMTVHVSKGLQNQVVMVPYLWTGPPHVSAPVVTHDPDTGDPMLTVAYEKGGAVHEEAKRAFAEEGDRLAYVALTRAQERLVVWAAPGARDTNGSRLMTRLCQRVGKEKLGDLDEFRSAIGQLAQEAPDGCIGLETFVVPPATHGVGPDEPTGGGDQLIRSRWERSLGLPRRRWSFSALTADQHGAADGAQTAQRSEDATGAGDVGAHDEGSDDLEVPDAEATRAAGPSAKAAGGVAVEDSTEDSDPWADLGAGAAGPAFGTLVHEALEAADLESSTLEDELGRAIADRDPPSGLHQIRLARAIAAAVTTPLGVPLGSLTLARLPRADQLRELDFDLPLDGAVRPTAADIGRCVDAWLPPGDLMAGRTFDLGSAAAKPLAGMLTGSIDLVVRARGSGGEPDRFVVADYKTNLLAPKGTSDPEAAHPDRLADAMAKHDYQLQALLYEVALHRYLRWRLPGYDPEVHLGGAAYLFLRGMAGPDTPVLDDGRRYGVFTWQPPAALIVALSDLLAGADLDEVTP
ncbi:MAG: UvrD-helicase domain-containing protein [Microthrixaceae bacterium]